MAASMNAPGPPPPPKPPPPAYQSDPGYVAAENTYNAQETGLQAFLRQQRSQALINFGAPGLLNGLGFSVDPNTASAAAANPYSTYALLGKGRDDAARGIVNSLAGRNMVRSGDYGYYNAQNAQNYGSAVYKAEQLLLAALGVDQQNYLTQHNANVAARNAQQQAAYQYYVDNPPPPTPYDAIYGLGTGSAGGEAASQLAKLLSPTTLLRTLDDNQWRNASGQQQQQQAAAPAPPPPSQSTGQILALLR